MNCYDYVRKHYDVPAATGRRICFRGREGIIAEPRGHYIGVNFDDDKPGRIVNVHPTDEVTYLDIGALRKPSRGQANYQRYLRADSDLPFSEWMGFGAA